MFNLYFDTLTRLDFTDHQPDAGLCLSYHLDADLVENRKKLTSEVSVADLEYADDVAMISDSYKSLCTLLKSMDSTCHDHMRLTINYKKTKLYHLKMLPIPHLPLFFILTVIPLRWYHLSSTLKVLSPTIIAL